MCNDWIIGGSHEYGVAMTGQVGGFLAGSGVAMAALALAGCSVATPPSVASSPIHATLPPIVRMELTGGPDQAANPMMNRLAAELTAQLARHGVRVDADAPFTLTATVSQRFARVGVTQDSGEGTLPIHWMSAPRKHTWFQACDASRLHVDLIVQRTETHTAFLTAQGEMDDCEFSDARIAELAATLVQQIIPG